MPSSFKGKNNHTFIILIAQQKAYFFLFMNFLQNFKNPEQNIVYVEILLRWDPKTTAVDIQPLQLKRIYFCISSKYLNVAKLLKPRRQRWKLICRWSFPVHKLSKSLSWKFYVLWPRSDEY